MRRRTIYIDLDSYRSLVRGWGSRELLTELRRRPPTYVRPSGESRGGWSVQESTARSLIALAEHRNFDVVVTGPRTQSSMKTAAPADSAGRAAEQLVQTGPVDPGAGLW